MIPILQPKTAYVFDYPAAVKFAETQNEVFWLANEIKVEKDVQDIMVNMTEAERHGVITVLKLFTHYEVKAGVGQWGGRILNRFQRADIQMMAQAFAFFESNVHAPFYNKLNEALHLNTEEFYNSYVEDETLKERMEFIDEVINHEDDLISIGTFAMVEGAILYSSFAYLKHFQSKGKNKLLNVVRGINFSVRDENLHCLGGSWLFNTIKYELEHIEKVDPAYFAKVEDYIRAAARKLYEHECRIVDMIFEKGPIDGITDVQMKHFIASRINLVLKDIGITREFEVSYNPIAEWFYDGINAYQMNDFFTGIGNQYNRNWNESEFIWGQID